MSAVDEICAVLTANARANILASKEAAMRRDIGAMALDIDFYSKAERDKPCEDYDFHAHGRHYKGAGSRWCVVKVKWNGSEWKRVRKLTGPLQFTDALSRLTEEVRKTGLERAA